MNLHSAALTHLNPGLFLGIQRLQVGCVWSLLCTYPEFDDVTRLLGGINLEVCVYTEYAARSGSIKWLNFTLHECSITMAPESIPISE